jgi:DNA-binding transcriptional MerR regulator
MTPDPAGQVIDHFLTGELQELAGLSKPMVDYLCRHGLLQASKSRGRGYGKRRRFDFSDVLLARSIRKLLDAEVSVLSMRNALVQLRRLLDAEATLRDRRIVIRDRVAYLTQPNRPAVNLLAGGQMTFSFLLDIEDTWRKAEPLVVKRKATDRARIERAIKKRKERMA